MFSRAFNQSVGLAVWFKPLRNGSQQLYRYICFARYVCTYACARMCIHIYLYVHTYKHSYIHTHTCIWACHAYVHTYTCASLPGCISTAAMNMYHYTICMFCDISLCMYASMFVCTYACIYYCTICIFVIRRMHVSMYVCVQVRMYVRMPLVLCTCMCICAECIFFWLPLHFLRGNVHITTYTHAHVNEIVIMLLCIYCMCAFAHKI